MDKHKSLVDQLEEAQNKIKNLQNELTKVQNKSSIILIADKLHEKICKSSHTDGCAWFYCDETSYYDGRSIRAQFYKMAQQICKGEDEDVVLRIINKL